MTHLAQGKPGCGLTVTAAQRTWLTAKMTSGPWVTILGDHLPLQQLGEPAPQGVSLLINPLIAFVWQRHSVSNL